MKKVITAIAAGAVLVAGAFAASTISMGAASAQTTQTTTTEATDDGIGPREEVLDEILASLVADGTLSQDEAAIVKERFVQKHEELMAERQERMEARREVRSQIEGFLEDDVITGDELAQLPDDHPFRNEDGVFADAFSDGEITRDELRAIGVEHRQERRERLAGRYGLDA